MCSAYLFIILDLMEKKIKHFFSFCFVSRISGFFPQTLDNITGNCIYTISLSRSLGAKKIGYATLIGDDLNVLVQYHRCVSL